MRPLKVGEQIAYRECVYECVTREAYVSHFGYDSNHMIAISNSVIYFQWVGSTFEPQKRIGEAPFFASPSASWLEASCIYRCFRHVT